MGEIIVPGGREWRLVLLRLMGWGGGWTGNGKEPRDGRETRQDDRRGCTEGMRCGFGRWESDGGDGKGQWKVFQEIHEKSRGGARTKEWRLVGTNVNKTNIRRKAQ